MTQCARQSRARSIYVSILAGFLSWFGIAVADAQRAPSPTEVAAFKGLHLAAAKGDHGALVRLIKQGAELNVRDGWGRTALMVSAYKRDHKTARMLIKAGADLNALDVQAYDVLTISAVEDDVKMVDLALASGANPKLITSPYKGTALIAAAHLGHDGVVLALIKAGADLDHVNNLGWTALIEAVVLGNGGKRHQATVKALVDAGASLDIADRQGRTPLQLAKAHNYRAIVAILEKAAKR
jgi:ankyrin repeat protein